MHMDDIDPDGNELWFKFLVLHIYHAGAKNVESDYAIMNLCKEWS